MKRNDPLDYVIIACAFGISLLMLIAMVIN